MRLGRLAVLMGVVAFFTACSGRQETVTGGYGGGLLSGQVVVNGVGGSAAGVEVSVRGTGQTMTLAADGEFLFAAVPENAQLDFRRAADGIEASLLVEKPEGRIVIDVSGSAARKSSRRRSSGRGSGEAFQFEGSIRTATADSLVVYTSKKEEVTFALTPETVIRKGNRTLTVADLLPDMRVHVKARKVGEGYTAIEVKVQEGELGGDPIPPATEYEGTVRSASAGQLVVFTSHREEVTFVLTAETVIRKGNTPVLAAEIQVGWRVHVKATTNADTTKTATLVIVQSTSGEDVELEGTVASVAASTLVVTTATGDVTVETAASTQIRKQGKKIRLDQVVVGDKVEVEGRRTGPASVEAKKITVED